MVGSFPSPEEVFEDRYRIVSIINRGGFGRVYRAQQLELNRDVAIKVLQPVTRDGMDADEESQRLGVVKKRFEREAQLVSQLRDSHTVVMHDFGTTLDGLLYMVLEYIDGKSLTELVEEEGALDPERAVKITRQVLWSLQEAHALNMLHRDVKPQNIMVFDHAGRRDQVKVLDFGLAKSAESAEFRAEDPDLTGDQVILGTPRYMSPEQIRGEPLQPSTDIYSLGLVLFEMLAGYKAVTGESTMNTLARHLNDQPIKLPDDVDVPTGLRDIVNRMLIKTAPERLQTAEDVLDALEFWDAETSVLGGSTSDPLTMAPAFLEERRKQTLIWSAAGVFSLFLVVAVIYAAMPDEQSAQATEIIVDAPEGTDSLGIPPTTPTSTPRPAPAEVLEMEDENLIAEADPDEPPPPVARVDAQPSEAAAPLRESETAAQADAGAVADAADMGALMAADGGTVAAEIPDYPEPIEPEPADDPPEKKSTKPKKSGKKDKEKVKLNIGILK